MKRPKDQSLRHLTSRKTAGLTALRACLVNEAHPFSCPPHHSVTGANLNEVPKYVAFLLGHQCGQPSGEDGLSAHFVRSIRFFQTSKPLSPVAMLSSISRLANTGLLEKKIPEHLLQNLGYEVATFVLLIGEVERIAGAQPFSAAELKTRRQHALRRISTRAALRRIATRARPVCGNK